MDKKPKREEFGSATAVLNKITTTIDGGARITLDLTSLEADLIKNLLEIKLKGSSLVHLVFSY